MRNVFYSPQCVLFTTMQVYHILPVLKMFSTKLLKCFSVAMKLYNGKKINFRASLKVGSCLADSGLHLTLEMTKLNI